MNSLNQIPCTKCKFPTLVGYLDTRDKSIVLSCVNCHHKHRFVSLWSLCPNPILTEPIGSEEE